MDRRVILVGAILWGSACLGTSVAQAQFFFDTEAVFLTRNNDGGSPWIGGPGGVNTSGGGYDIQPGYLVSFGYVGEQLQVDTSFTQITPWTSGSNGTFGSDVYLDQSVPPTPGDTSVVFPGFLNTAANSSFAGANESDEREFLTGARYSTSNVSNYRDFEVNIGTSQVQRPWRFAIGYRNIQLDEKNVVRMSGEFETDGAGNNGISNTALINAGATNISGGADGFFQSTPPTYLNYQVNGNAQNEMNGAQAVFSYRIYDGSWLTLEGTSKAGIYRNVVSGQVQETAAASGFDDSVYQRTMNSEVIGAAFAGNLGLRAVIGVTDYIDLVIGYQILFLSGVGLGPDQMNGIGSNAAGATTYHVQHDGSLIANGGTIGLRIYW